MSLSKDIKVLRVKYGKNFKEIIRQVRVKQNAITERKQQESNKQ